MSNKYNRLFEIFKEISAVPRNSKQEQKIVEYLCTFAEKNNLWYMKDNNNNVLIKKSASNILKNTNSVLFQAHTDMVCVKERDSKHNFDIEGLELLENKDTIYANKTSLGADNGIGIAYLLLLLESKDIKLPPIECLFTSEEEIGMNGVSNFNYNLIDSKYMINLDSEEDNKVIIGCAGGITNIYTKRLPVFNEYKLYKLELSGLCGGHSGIDINKNRKNANDLMIDILNNFDDISLASINGGEKRNAIANSCTAVFKSHLDVKQIIENTLKEKNMLKRIK